jgi:hypothetical protein
MEPHYRHTQVGWVILGVAAAIVALGWATVPRGAPLTPMLVIAALVVLLFGALTVEVDGEEIRLRFGMGLVRKRIPLREVRSWREVRNPWYAGWGIHLAPGGVMWNVSGLGAVELVLGYGKRFRIGTDEPLALAAAITRGRGEAPAATPEGPWCAPGGVAWKAVLLALALGAALVGALFWAQLRPPKVTVEAKSFAVDTPFFGTSVDAADVVEISLETRLPRVLVRTNGFAGAGTLRGRFRLDGLGEGRLYVEQGFSPYLLVRLRRGYVIVNFREPQRTRALYAEMARAWPGRVVAPAR